MPIPHRQQVPRRSGKRRAQSPAAARCAIHNVLTPKPMLCFPR
nr:MAG TPA: hypothetical protein [Caudoviricetes sp.]